MLTPYHCKYLTHNLTRKSVDSSVRLSISLFNTSVDLNLHQIEVALDEQHVIQQKLQSLGKQQHLQHQEIFKVEDERI
jgi:hypothetical protein